MTQIPASTAATLCLQVQPNTVPRFLPLCQQGFQIKVPACGSIRTILCQYLGLSQDYLEGRVQTIFLNGKAVDDLDATSVGPGDTLALSAALPGLVGATMRRGGYLAGLRANISQGEQDQALAGGECLVKLKLFNLLTDELGPFFLAQGIWINQAVLATFLKRQPEDFWTGLLAAELNGEVLEPQNLPALAWPDGDALVRLNILVSSK